MIYCCFELTDHFGIPDVVFPQSVEYTNVPIAGKYYVEMLRYPKVFHAVVVEEFETKRQVEKREVDGSLVLRGTFVIGWNNLPTYQFVNGEFIPIDLHETDIAKKHQRRKEIKERIAFKIAKDTELKKMRKALKAIVAAIPGLAELPEVADFLSFSDHIESEIAHFPKELVDQIDVHRANGVSPTRMKAFMRTGVDYGQSRADLVDEPFAFDNGAQELLERGRQHAKRMKIEESLQKGLQ